MENLSLFEPAEILTVSEFLGAVNGMFSELGMVKIQGEIDEVSLRTSYGFFDLKESSGGVKAEASVGCFVGWKSIQRFQHLLKSGMEVVMCAYPSIYVKNGSFRLEVMDIQPVGEGALQKAFEALKQKLAQKGYFDSDRKRELPLVLKNVGIITSMSGAAVTDFQKNLGLQGLQVEYMDVRVEGESAEESITEAIKQFNELRPHLDALILMRGGGSYESLKAFNSERIADAIYYSRIPVITGIGHEKDQTIADFVADVRCSTPTAIAGLLVTQRENVLNSLRNLENDLVYALDDVFEDHIRALDSASENMWRSTEVFFEHHSRRVLDLQQGLERGLQYVFHTFENIEHDFAQAAYEFDCSLRLMSEKVGAFEQQLFSLNPSSILERGYSITYDKHGNVLKNATHIQSGDPLRIRLQKGEIHGTVE